MILPEFLVEGLDGEILITGHRITLYHFIDGYWESHSAEKLQELYPTLDLDLIQKIITFYLQNKAEVHAYVAREKAEIERQRLENRGGPDWAAMVMQFEARGRSS